MELSGCMWSPKRLLLSMLHVLIWAWPRLCKIGGQGVGVVAVQHRMEGWLLRRDKNGHAKQHTMALNKKRDGDQEENNRKRKLTDGIFEINQSNYIWLNFLLPRSF